jgi:hypothetical protein
LEESDLVKALHPYQIIERTNVFFLLEYSESMNWNMYFFTIICFGIGFYFVLRNSTVRLLPAVAGIVLVVVYLAICFLFRYVAIKRPVAIAAEKGRLNLKYKKFFNGEREITYNAQALRGIQPSSIVGKYQVLASIRIRLVNGPDEELYFAGSEKTSAIQQSQLIASLFSQVLGIQLLK